MGSSDLFNDEVVPHLSEEDQEKKATNMYLACWGMYLKYVTYCMASAGMAKDQHDWEL